MDLTKTQFDILSYIAESSSPLTQREIESKTGYSLGTVNNVIKEMTELGYVKNRRITDDGLIALEPYRAKRAVFIAAGFGSRLAPITFNTPKPLVRVYGVRIIDRMIDACLNVGINDIYIVRGYLADQFDQLLYKYPMIKFLENPVYNESNSISSAMVARFLLSNSYVIESDLLIYNPAIIKKYYYNSKYYGIKRQRTDDWVIKTKNGIIYDEVCGGEGENIYQMVGISYWTENDGHKLSYDISEVYQSPGGKERFWEQVPIIYRKEHYTVEIQECTDSDVVEIDTLNELKAIDKTYDV